MTWDITIIIAACVIAIIGAIWDDPPRPAKGVLIIGALLVAIAGLWKVAADEKDKQWMETVVSSNLRAPPDKIQEIDSIIRQFAAEKGYKASPTYYYTDLGLSFLLSKGSDEEAIVFDNWDLGAIMKDASSTKAMKKKFEEQFVGEYGTANADYNEDVYSRVATLCSGAIQQMRQRNPKDYFWDAGYGVRVDFELGNKIASVLITPSDIAAVPKSPRAVYLGRVLSICRQKIAEVAP
jgi:hypothetical protein